MSDELTIGLDIGGTKMALVVADRQGDIKASQTLPTQPGETFSDTVKRVTALFNKYLEHFDTVCGIGIGVPGPVDVARGVALQAVNLGWENIAIRDAICRRLARPLPVYVENDVNVGAIGEQLFGITRGIKNYVYLIIGTGVGGAVMIDNRLMRGASNSEMEIGHVSLDPANGRVCTCGQRGCLEMSLSGKGIVAHARQHIDEYPESRLRANVLTTHEIIRAAEYDDPLAIHVMQEAANALGIACAWCANLFNPGRIILGGGLIHATYHLLEAEALRAARARCLPLNYETVTISLSKLTDGALGASALVWYYRNEGHQV